MAGIRVFAAAAALMALVAQFAIAAEPFTIRIVAPANRSQVSGTVNISTKSARSALWVNIFIDGSYYASSPPSAFQWDSTAVANGPHKIRAEAMNARRRIGTSSVTVDVENAAAPTAQPSPTPAPSSNGVATLTAPGTGSTISGTVTASAELAPSVAWVNFYLDATFVAAAPSSNPSASVDTTITVDGSHSISVRAYDASGNQLGSDSASIMVANGDSGVPGARAGYYSTLPPHANLPSASECAGAVLAQPSSEAIAQNAGFNQTTPTSSELAGFHQQPLWNDEAPASDFNNVDGDFVGTTDQIIRWASCKWGLDENAMRAEAWSETFWLQSTTADRQTNPSLCQTPDWNGWDGSECWQSYGIFQLKVLDFNIWPEARDSTAFNADFRGAYLRACMNGDIAYMNRRTPNAGYPDYSGANTGQMFWGCMGEWASGGWYDVGAIDYITAVKAIMAAAPWPH
ncbi:MAG TPA: Ig-like domain-containing protein [Candidatus Binataceae bacterium]|nr:Ig-like domain-containing protein [Candidatus Binataceae bacterium]